MAADLHTHSDASPDSSVTIDERVAMAREAELDTVAVTDHYAIDDWFDRRETVLDGISLIAGVELNPCEGEFGVVHVLGLFVDPAAIRERLAARDGSWQYEAAIEDVHAAGGAAILAHPGRYDCDLDGLVAHLSELGLDGIEVEYPYDRYDALAPEIPYTPPDEIRRIAGKYGLVRTGGSDCHGDDHEHVGAVSVPRTRVRAVREAAGRHR